MLRVLVAAYIHNWPNVVTRLAVTLGGDVRSSLIVLDQGICKVWVPHAGKLRGRNPFEDSMGIRSFILSLVAIGAFERGHVAISHKLGKEKSTSGIKNFQYKKRR